VHRHEEKRAAQEDWPGNHIAQMLDTACPGDPVTDYALNFQKLLRKQGYETIIFALNIVPGVRPEDFRPIKDSSVKEPREGDILLYHFSANSKVNPDYMRFDCRRVLVWHGEVPGRTVSSFDPSRAAALERTAREVSWLAPYTEAVIADSDSAAEQIRALGFSCPVHVITPMIPFEHFDAERGGELPAADLGKQLFLAVGDILPERRIGDMISCFAAYNKIYNRNSRLMLVGRCDEASPYYLTLRDYEETLSLDPGAVFFAGRLSERDLLPYFLHAAAYLDMSAFETFPLPLAEAMFLKLPVLSCRTPVTSQLLGKDALYLPEADAALSAGLMDRVIRDTALRGAMIVGAKDRLGAFTWAVQQETFTRVMQDMVGAGSVQMTMMKKKAGE
jgi:glycosyltransferase involved in cell wall biosynthesis